MRHLIISVLALLPRLSIVAVALFLFVGTVHADILVSNHGNGCIGLYNDDGTVKDACFINPGTGTNSSEGLQCVKLSSNAIYVVSSMDNMLREYDLTTGHQIGNGFPVAGVSPGFSSLSTNAAGTVLYLAAVKPPGTKGNIVALDLPPSTTSPCPYTAPCTVSTFAELDAVVGPDGFVYATGAGNNTGVLRYAPYVPDGVHPWNPPPPDQFIPPGTPKVCGTLDSAAGMVFDGSGNLWVTNVDFSPNDPKCDGIFEFTGPQSKSPNPGTLLNFTSTPNVASFGLDVSPVNPPGLPKDSCMGCIVVTAYGPNTVEQIDPTKCKGGTCTLQPLITQGLNGPKFAKFTENCCDTGYVEICKMSCVTNPVTGNFTFTATNQGSNIGPITVPVNACSGAIQIPNGTVTVNEQFPLGGGGGTEVTGIVAYNYDYLGNQINALLSYNRPFQTGNVDVVSGDVSTETVVGFTNCASGPGELKLCKVAGNGVQVNAPFTFEVEWLEGGFFQFKFYTVPAGPPPGGYCTIAGNYPVGTQVNVSEPFLPAGIGASNITVAPADRGGYQQLGGSGGFDFYPFVNAIIDSGTTEVTFTNATQSFFSDLGPSDNPYQCGTLNSGWNVAGSGSTLGKSYIQAAKFQAAISGTVSKIDLGLTYTSGTNLFDVSIRTDNAGLPGDVLAYYPNLSAGMCHQLVSVVTNLALTGGQSYWVVLNPTSLSSSTLENWHYNSVGVKGTVATSNNGGTTWSVNNNATFPAFDVLP